MSTPTPAVAAYVPVYATREPYLTVAEFLAAPTGVDPSQLIPGADETANKAALGTVLASASSYADVICQQVLAATTDMQVGTYRVWRDGTIRVAVDFTPLIAVTAVLLGTTPTDLTAFSDLSGLWIERKVVTIPIGGVALPRDSSMMRGRRYARVSYVNGYANTALAAPAAAGAPSVQVTQPVGIFPGLPLTVIDDAAGGSEMITVAAGYTIGSATVPLTAPLNSAHAAGVAVSALPREVKQAVICLAAHLIKTRGAEALSFAKMDGGPDHLQDTAPGYTEEYQQAVDLLTPHRRVR